MFNSYIQIHTKQFKHFTKEGIKVIYTNPLANESDIQKYRDWLDNQGTHFLNRLLNSFNLPVEYQATEYPNLPLRIQLVEKALSKRLN